MSELIIASVERTFRIGFDVLFVGSGGVFALFALYLVIVAAAALFYTCAPGLHIRASARIAVVVPAYNEADYIARTIESLEAQTYPRALFDIVVVADNCTDETAAMAHSAGAEVLVRDEPGEPGKGQALRFAIDDLLARTVPVDAIVVVDADSIAEPRMLARLVQAFDRGADAVQGESLLWDDGSSHAALRSVAYLLVNRVRPAGRAVLHLPSKLSGNGMLFSRRLLLEQPWNMISSVEDLEYSIRLRRAGVRPVFAGGAIVRSPAPPNAQAAETQRLRHEGGKLHMARAHVPRLVADAIRNRRPLLLDTALELALPPLSLLVTAAALEAVVGGVLVWQNLLSLWALTACLVALVSIPVYVLLGLHAGGAPRAAYVSLGQAPWFVLRNAVRSHRLLTFRSGSWVRTERPSDRTPDGPRRSR